MTKPKAKTAAKPTTETARAHRKPAAKRKAPARASAPPPAPPAAGTPEPAAHDGISYHPANDVNR